MVIKEAEEDFSDEGIEVAMENHAAEHSFQSRSVNPPTRAEVRCRLFCVTAHLDRLSGSIT